MRVEAAKLLVDARNAGRAVLEFVKGKSLSDYRADLLLRSAVERQRFILGEALSQLRTRDPAVFDSIPDARRIVGFRNLLAYGMGRWTMAESGTLSKRPSSNPLLYRGDAE